MNQKIRVLLVDDHVVVRKGTRALLATEDDIQVVGEAADGQQALVEIKRLKPEVILLDLIMPHMDGIDVIRQTVADNPDVRILVLTSFAADDKVFASIKAGAMGYLLKDSSPQELVQAIRQVYRGESSLSPLIARKVLREITNPPHKLSAVEPLTRREMDVLRIIARGMSNQEIAAELVISEATVRTHVSNILAKLHLASRTQAALYALQEGLASLDEVDLTSE